MLAVSEQMVAIEQLRVQPELLYQYIQKIQELYKEYGNIKLNELPAGELQQLQELISNMNIKKCYMFRRYNANGIRQSEDARANDANIERCRKRSL